MNAIEIRNLSNSFRWMYAANLGIKNAEKEVVKVLKMVRMESAASNKYKNCSLGMKQRIGIAMALLGHPTLLVLDESIIPLSIFSPRTIP